VLAGSSGKKRLEQAEADRDVAESDTSLSMKLPEDFANDLLSAGRATAFQPYDKAPMRERVQIDRADPPDYRLDLAIIRAAADFARLRKTGRRAT
jgi:hypothetical protein